MKILIENYNSHTSTEASYFHQALTQAEVEVFLWQRQQYTAFDIFDIVDPDIFITKYKNICPDTLKRMSNTKCKIIINVSGISENEAANLEETINESKIQCPFVFYNLESPKGFKKIKTVQIMQGADIFLPHTQSSPKQVAYGLVSDNLFDVGDKLGNVYHKICLGETSDEADVSMNIFDLSNVLHIYSNVLLAGKNPDIVCGQVFLDSTIRITGKCSVHLDDKNQKMVSDYMLHLFPELPGKQELIKNYLRTTILRKHSCINRAERLMKNIGDDEICQKLRKIKDNIKI